MNCTKDDLQSIVRYALQTTRAPAVWPFHPTVNIRVGDDGAETHAYVRARRIVKSDGTTWDREVLLREFKRQFEDAADGVCPHCAGSGIRLSRLDAALSMGENALARVH